MHSNIVNQLSDLKHRVFPRPFERLALEFFARNSQSIHNLVGCEIGVYKAFHALSLLESVKIEKLYLIDPYAMYDKYLEGHAHYGVDQIPLSDAQIEAIDRLKEYENKIVWLNLLSDDAVKNIPDELDFVYIDGNHAYDFVKQDIKNYWPKVKSGGIIGGHDFYNGYCREHDGVVKAVSEFAVHNNLTLQVELPDWWIVKP
jgi:hypothetical protein